MKKHKLDELLRKKMDISSKVPEHIWDKIQHELDQQDLLHTASQHKGFRRYFMPLAASIGAIMLLGGGWAIYQFLNPLEALPEDLIQLTQQPTPTPSTSTNVVQEEVLANQQEETVQHAGSSVYTNRLSEKEFVSSESSEGVAFHYPSTGIVLQDNPFNTVETQIYPKSNLQQIAPNIDKIQHQEIQLNNYQPERGFSYIGMSDQEKGLFTFDENGWPEQQKTPKNKNMYYGVSGAYNYGNLNEGGAVAVNTRKNLNNRFFVDGSVGLVVNNSSPMQGNFNGDFITYKTNPQSISTKNRTNNLFTNSNTFYFVQVNPSIGVNVGKSLDISVGPDYQQMVSNMDADVVMFKTSKLLPRYDMGVTGKAEVKIAPNLKAGVLYREGLTPIIANDNNISSRRYLQLQLKIQLPDKKNK